MGKIADKLRRECRKALEQKIVPMAALKKGEENAASIQTVEQMIGEGHHPLHAIYKNLANLISLFTEEVVFFPFLYRACNFLSKAEDLYTPGYPPMSPITTSHYIHWTNFDVPFGADQETLGECFVALSDLLGLEPLRVEAAQNLCQSRLGLYQLIGSSGDAQFRLRELITEREFETMIPTGFAGQIGELILLRILPPLQDLPSPHIAVTTPYLLEGYDKAEWEEYFRRQDILPGAPGAEERLYRHMKRGKDNDDWYWSEFIFYGYVNHRSDAIFLAGFPDRPETQPHHPDFDETKSPIRFKRL